MKSQWILITGILFALIVALFAVINVEPVPVSYYFGSTEFPLVIVILGSVFMGGAIIGTVGFFRTYSFHKEVKELKKENAELTRQLEKKNTLTTQQPKVEEKQAPKVEPKIVQATKEQEKPKQ